MPLEGGANVMPINPPTVLGYKLNEEANTRKTLRMAWTNTNTNNTYREINQLKKHETASGADYARFKRQRATLRNFNDSAK